MFAVIKIDGKIAFGANILKGITGSPWTSALMMLLLCLWFYNGIVKDNGTKTTGVKTNIKA